MADVPLSPDAAGMPVVVGEAPRFTAAEAAAIARSLYGVEGEAAPLPGERDQNFRLSAAEGRRFVLKIANATELEALLDFQTAALAHLAARTTTLQIPRTCPAADGRTVAAAHDRDGRRFLVRLLTWVDGVPLAEVRPHSPRLLRSLGRRLAELDRALADFSHPAMDRPFAWDLRQAARAAAETPAIGDAVRRAGVERLLARFEAVVAPALAPLRTSVIHNDWNDYNVLVSVPGGRPDAGEGEDPREATGAVDFGDMVRSHTIGDLAVAAAYAMLGKADPVSAGALVVSGYHDVLPIEDGELAVLFDLIRTRLCLSVVMAARQQAAAPDNTYLGISQEAVGALLDRLAGVTPGWSHYVFRDACGLEPCPRGARVAAWLREHPSQAGPVIDHDLRTAPVLVLDGSVESPEYGVADLADIPAVSEALFGRMRAAGALVGIGRYDEARLVYAASQFVEPGNDGAEARTVHMGLDLFVPAGSPVYAPLDGRVHAVHHNAAPFDYGPVVILAHATDAGEAFHTLYGHLGMDSLTRLRAGMPVRRGDRIGEVGGMDVNGGWPPHLHLQVIADLLGRGTDFPGVAAPERRRVWRSLCPDPGPMLGAPGAASPSPALPPAEILGRRRRLLGPGLRVAYREPLSIVRGFMQHLYDAEGRRYLDAVNNVPHVGHCHPDVVRAERDQAAVLNTNTRYLHERIVRYAERLTATLPHPLSVCHFVNSGSEANELALRLARAHTGRRGILVLDHAYHGNTGTLIDVSPYKCEGPGGAGLPPHVRKLRLPVTYGGASGPDAAAYGREAAQAIDALAAAGSPVAAFLCEALPSCAGQFVLPAGCLAAVYEAVRAGGGVCIADEVQVGLGRVGSHMWGFETQGVVPDIVTMGKPIGNGYPLGAVVATPAVAASFDTGMEFFSTFGGNPVACAVGLAVLDVVQGQRLQAHARRTGARFADGLRALMARHALVGDVRGLGLFLGVELVTDRDTRAPATRQAAYLVNRLRDRRILTSTDGPFHNVIKIKPPLPFTPADADLLVSTLDELLSEDPAQGSDRDLFPGAGSR